MNSTLIRSEPAFEERVFVLNNPLSYGLPLSAKIWVYWVSSFVYDEVPRYKFLIRALSELGLWRGDANVLLLRKENYPEPIANLMEAFDVKELPFLVILSAMLGLDKPPIQIRNAYLLKKDLFTDYLLEKEERVANFIEGLYEAGTSKKQLETT